MTFIECFQGLKQGCILSPILFSMLINELANEILEKGKRGVSLGPAEIELFLLLFADDLTLLSSTVIGLQNQLNVLQEATQRLGLTVNLHKIWKTDQLSGQDNPVPFVFSSSCCSPLQHLK